MRRRLTLSILATVAATLVLAGIGTLALARVGARKATEDELRRQAESTATLVALGQERLGSFTTADVSVMRELFCEQPLPDSSSAAAREGYQRLRATVCLGITPASIEQARAELCDETPNQLREAMPAAMESQREAFCASPSEETFERMRAAMCRVPIPDWPDAAARKRFEQARRVMCTAAKRRTEQRDELESTLEKESIDFVVLDANDELSPDSSLPPGMNVTMLHPDRLRNGQIVSGPIGNRVFAAAPVDPAAETLSVIVIDRPADPVIGGSVQWFLMAAGITLAAGALVAAWLSRALTHPLSQATAVTARIADGDLSSRLPERREGGSRHELDELAHSINTMADSLERSRGLERQFLLSVSHDLRTPLTSIRGYAEAIADGAAPDAQQAASIILAESRRLERLVQDLLDLANLEARRFTLRHDRVDLTEVAGDSVDGFRREIEESGLSLALANSTAPVLASGDADRLQQVIANLVENALKFAATAITVTVVADPVAPRIEVADDGPGIAAEDLPHVFERLYVAAARPKRKETGSGLGLAIVRELVDAMGGTVHADTNPGGGTRMVVTLPAAAPGPPLPPPPPPPPPRPT